jgi:hypothetical protein
VRGTSVSRFEQDVDGVTAVDRAGNASAATRAG